MTTHFANVSELLQDALKKNTAVGAFNFTNLETLKAIIESAEELETGVILQASESAIKYMGMDYVVSLAKTAAANACIKVALHLDHGKDFELCKLCIDKGFSSVMIDKSSLSLADNISETKKVVDYALSKNVSVEAELGTLAGIEDEVNVSAKDALYTNPKNAREFVEKTGITSLAIAIGTSHGPNKGKLGNPKLDIARLKEIKEILGDFPLVLHGASSVYEDCIILSNNFGSSIENAFGVLDEDIKSAIKNGIAKINVDTDIRIAFLGALRKSLANNPSSIDLRKHFAEGTSFAKEVIKRKLTTFLNP